VCLNVKHAVCYNFGQVTTEVPAWFL